MQNQNAHADKDQGGLGPDAPDWAPEWARRMREAVHTSNTELGREIYAANSELKQAVADLRAANAELAETVKRLRQARRETQ